MKKFLIVLLVLALASFASAVEVKLTSGGLTAITVSPGTVVDVDMSVDIAVKGCQYIDFLADAGLDIAAVGAWIPALQAAGGPGTLVGGDIIDAVGNQAGGTTDTVANTVLYSFQVTANATGNVTPFMGATDAFFTTASPGYAQADTQTALSITIPEPMTIALLGLGGLFLRRRK
jgi:hypothetical protein